MSLAELSDSNGIFRVLAVDHRDSLRVFLQPDAPDSVPAIALTEIKSDLTRMISPFATGVMLEPEYSIPQLINNGSLAPGVGFFAALESQGYLDDPEDAPTTVLDGWSVERAAASGASSAKLLLPYHPDSPTAAAQIDVATRVLADCRRVGIPLALEPLFFGLQRPDDRGRVVLATAEIFAALGPDLLKLPFPVDPEVVTDPGERAEACARITQCCTQPWAMLSGGGTFESFLEQVEIAAANGGSRIHGRTRALWGEAARCPAEERVALIEQLVLPRWHQLCAAAARP